jgi:hypothetical protein
MIYIVVGLYTLSFVGACVRVTRVEVGSNISAVALRLVQGDENGTQYLGYNRATLFLGNINMETWPSRLGEYTRRI